jgi:hypothetical protein
MSAAASGAPPAPLACPACGALLRDGAVVCRRCGTITPLEQALQAGRHKVRRAVQGTAGRIGRIRPSRITLLWIAALLPLVMAPPLIAALYAVVALALRRQDFSPREIRHLAAIIVIAALNLWLSYEALGLLLQWAGGGLESLMDALPMWLHRPPAGASPLRLI